MADAPLSVAESDTELPTVTLVADSVVVIVVVRGLTVTVVEPLLAL